MDEMKGEREGGTSRGEEGRAQREGPQTQTNTCKGEILVRVFIVVPLPANKH